MPREAAVNIENNFIQGLITETTALRFPEQACTDCDNVVFDETGKAKRRQNYDIEDGAVSKDIVNDVDTTAFTEYLWNDVAGTGSLSFVVQQVGSVLQFYDVSNDTVVSASKKDFEVDLSTFATSGSLDVGSQRCQYTSVNGDLIVVNAFTNPISVRYKINTSDIESTAITVQVRDIRGLDDNLTTNQRLTSSLSNMITNFPAHYYNLLNQGWFTDPLTQWDTDRTDMPSNADIVATSRSSSTDSFDNALLTATTPATTLAPKGKFIMDVGVYDRQTAASDAGFTVDLSSASAATSRKITGLSSFTDIGNMTDISKAYDGVTNPTSTNSASKDGAPSQTETAISPSGLTTIVDSITTNEANVFDENLTTFATYINSTTSSLEFQMYIGKVVSTGEGIRVTKSVISGLSYSTSSSGSFGTPSVRLYGSNSSPSNATDGTLLASSSTSATNVTLNYTGSANFTHVWVAIVVTLTKTSGTFAQGQISWVELDFSETNLNLEPNNFIGKDFGVAGKQISSIRVHPTTNLGFHGQDDTMPFEIKLFGSATSPTDHDDGTELGSLSFTSDTTAFISITSSDIVTSFRYVWVSLKYNSTKFPLAADNKLYVGELEFFEVDSSAGDGDSEITDSRFTTVAALNNRLFYGGITSRALSNRIYFTQVLEDDSFYGYCYQRNDPTDENTSLLLSSDGGEIQINDMGRLVKLTTYENSVLAFATNGVWRIWNFNGGFSATSFQVDRISDIGTLSPYSFVSVDGVPYWWGDEGIYRIDYNPQFRSFSVTSITDETIRDFVLSIPASNRSYVKGAYDAFNKEIQWIYNSDATFTEVDYYNFDKGLTYNVLSNAFYPHSVIDSTDPKIRGILYTKSATRGDNSRLKFPFTIDAGSDYSVLSYADQDNSDYIDWTNIPTSIGQFLDISSMTGINDLTGNTGVYKNNNVSVAAAGASIKSSSDFTYAGVTFTTASKVSNVSIQGTSDSGYHSQNDTTITATLYAKTGSAPSSSTDGTVIGSLVFGYMADETTPRYITSGDPDSEWNHVWVRFEKTAGTSGNMLIGQVRVFTNESSMTKDYTSFFITGYRIKGQTQRFTQPNYIYVYLEESGTPSAFLQTYFDFANSSASNKWSTTQQLYNSNMTNRAVNFRKLKVRGKGRAMQFKVSSESGKPFSIIGWSVKDVGNADL